MLFVVTASRQAAQPLDQNVGQLILSVSLYMAKLLVHNYNMLNMYTHRALAGMCISIAVRIVEFIYSNLNLQAFVTKFGLESQPWITVFSSAPVS